MELTAQISQEELMFDYKKSEIEDQDVLNESNDVKEDEMD